MELVEKAKAKINLAIDVLGLREDGYHQVDMVMGALALHDSVFLQPAPTSGIVGSLDIDGLGPAVQMLKNDFSEENLVVRAYKSFANSMPEQNGIANYNFKLVKRIPIAAGLGGGSSDAAAILRALWRKHGGCSFEHLMRMAASLGSDVPFFIQGGIVRATGRGEILERLPVQLETDIILIKPDFPLSTAVVYKKLDLTGEIRRPDIDLLLSGLADADQEAIAAGAGNVLEDSAFKLHPELLEIKASIQATGAWLAMMSGSGPTIFGFFAADRVNYAHELLKIEYPLYDVIQTKFDLSVEAI
jgi:4-diphosphocytidyl-2-C-methyl-D-erythritol kinase